MATSLVVDRVSQAGRHYLPWVAQATVAGSAVVEFDDGSSTTIESSAFLDQARGVMLARYIAARSPELDEILERADLLRWFADYADQATSVPDARAPARPTQNRPYAIN